MVAGGSEELLPWPSLAALAWTAPRSRVSGEWLHMFTILLLHDACTLPRDMSKQDKKLEGLSYEEFGTALRLVGACF